MALLAAVAEGLLDDVPLDLIDDFRAALNPWLREHLPEILALDDQAPPLSDELARRLKTVLTALIEDIGGPASRSAVPLP